MILYSVGISLSPGSTIESGVAVREISTNKLLHIEKLFSMNDVQLFFDNYNSLDNSIFCVSLPWDNTMLEGKWRVQSKSYQLIHNYEDNFLNRDNWMQRYSTRGSDLLLSLHKKGVDVSRFETYLTRQKFNLYSNYKERSSADCKFLQSTLKHEFNLSELPSNMMPMAQLEAIVGTYLAEEKLKDNVKEIFRFKDLSVINLI